LAATPTKLLWQKKRLGKKVVSTVWENNNNNNLYLAEQNKKVLQRKH
jgi:hypothetical protein